MIILDENILEDRWRLLHKLLRHLQNARDLKLINQHADRLNEEARDVLAYQTIQ
jgi:hypothetical protein